MHPDNSYYSGYEWKLGQISEKLGNIRSQIVEIDRRTSLTARVMAATSVGSTPPIALTSQGAQGNSARWLIS